MSPNHHEILTHIKNNPLCSVRDVFKSLDFTLLQVRRIITYLANNEFIDVNYKISSVQTKYYTIKE